MKFSELDSGMVVEVRGGDRYLVLKDTRGDLCFMNADGTSSLYGWGNHRLFDESMRMPIDSNYDIMKVFHAVSEFDDVKETTACLWEREAEKEMTLAEVSAALGYPVRIVEEKRR